MVPRPPERRQAQGIFGNTGSLPCLYTQFAACYTAPSQRFSAMFVHIPAALHLNRKNEALWCTLFAHSFSLGHFLTMDSRQQSDLVKIAAKAIFKKSSKRKLQS